MSTCPKKASQTKKGTSKQPLENKMCQGEVGLCLFTYLVEVSIFVFFFLQTLISLIAKIIRPESDLKTCY